MYVRFSVFSFRACFIKVSRFTPSRKMTFLAMFVEKIRQEYLTNTRIKTFKERVRCVRTGPAYWTCPAVLITAVVVVDIDRELKQRQPVSTERQNGISRGVSLSNKSNETML